MSLNSIQTVNNYTSELDKMYVQKAKTGFLTDNALAAEFVGAKTVIMPDVEFVGLADYDRDGGFNKAKTTIAQTSYTLSKDRGRSLQIDRMEMDEAGVANLAGLVLGEYVRTQVVPECDAYCLSKLGEVATANGNTKAFDEQKAISGMLDIINDVNDASGFDEELVAFVNPKMYNALMTAPELSRSITVDQNFKQGEVNLAVKKLNGVAIIPVSEGRMKTAFTFNSGESETAGGFSIAEGAEDIYCIVMPKSAASLVRKTEKMRIWTPDTNIDADAYKFDYRIYYDVFVKKNAQNTIHAIIG